MDQLQPQQPVQVYPNNPNYFPNQPNNMPMTQSSSSHNSSNGSFVSVFVVLAIVFVISVIACVVGRLCSKKSNGANKVKKSSHGQPQKQKEGKHNNNNKHNEFHNKRGGGDIEFGFDKKIASSKVAAAHGDNHYKGSKPHKNTNGGVRFSDNHIDFKLGP